MGITEGTINQDLWTLPSDDQGALEKAHAIGQIMNLGLSDIKPEKITQRLPHLGIVIDSGEVMVKRVEKRKREE